MPDDPNPSRIDPLAAPRAVSPTGTPVMPAVIIPVATAVVAAAGAAVVFIPESHWAHKACLVVLAIGAALGVSSPGWRRKE